MIIAFDVDDTLILPPEATGLDRDIPNYDTISIYRWFQAQGNTMWVWSGGGEDYARMWAEKLGLNPDRVLAKDTRFKDQIDIAFDDCDIDLAKVNVKVRRLNNSVKRTLPADRIKSDKERV